MLRNTLSWLRGPVWRVVHGPEGGAPSRRLTVRLLLGGLGLTYLVAFASFWVQVDGLIGSGGILPIAPRLAAILDRARELDIPRDWRLFAQFPTLCWLAASDLALHIQCALGVLCGALLVANIAPLAAALGAWICYHSLSTAGNVFMGYQWERLLLESGFLALFLASWRLRPRLVNAPEPPRLVLFLLWWLLFRLMFASGAGKLLHGNAPWHDLTALQIHYLTQPIPVAAAWMLHHAPMWYHKLSCAIMYFVEAVLPFFFFAPRRLRIAAFFGQVGLQVVIQATGNFGFFNLLTVVLCIPLLDDRFLLWGMPRRLRTRAERALGLGTEEQGGSADGGDAVDQVDEVDVGQQGTAPAPEVQRGRPRPRWIGMARAVPMAVLAAFLFSTSGVILAQRLWPGVAARLVGGAGAGETRSLAQSALGSATTWAQQLSLVGGYGAFIHLTLDRPEIIVEGSDDGTTWHAYEFPYKPGDVRRRPPRVAPHQPRLDWQMWFASLQPPGSVDPWFAQFAQRLLEGKPDVLALLASNPFPDAPPRYLRALVYDYRFADPAIRAATGAWWTRTHTRPYLPPVTLADGRLVLARVPDSPAAP